MVKPKTLTVNQNIIFTLLTFCSKENKKNIRFIILCWESKEPKKPKDKQICNDLPALVEAYFLLLLHLAYLLQLRLIFCCSCLLHRTYSRERERILKKEMKSKGWDGNYCCLLYQNVWMWFQNVWLLGILGYVESRMCGGEKISNGQWYYYSWCTYFLLFERLKNN